MENWVEVLQIHKRIEEGNESFKGIALHLLKLASFNSSLQIVKETEDLL